MIEQGGMVLRYLLDGHEEPMATSDNLAPALLSFAENFGGSTFLWHQTSTFDALAASPVVCNTSTTGTGKTLAAQLHLLRGGVERTLVVAPTNALIDQHVESWSRFCRDAGLPHRVIGLDAERLSKISVHLEGPEANNARRLFEIMSAPQQVLPDYAAGTPLVVITNPDLFYLATFMQYQRSKLHAAEAVLRYVDYLVVDEFHYYSGIQLIAFFFVMGFWMLTGQFQERQRRACILTATPEQEVRYLFDALQKQGLDIRWIEPTNAPSDQPMRPSLSPCRLELRIANNDMIESDITACLARWDGALKKGDDVAILLDSLGKVSRLYQTLQHKGFAQRVRRITGPTPRTHRTDAQRAPIILATPTVDIGYNFQGREKKSTPLLERVIFEAPSASRFWQRLGRAGRILPFTTPPDTEAQAVAFVPESVFTALRQMEIPETLTRKQLSERIASLGESYREQRLAPLLEEWAALAIAQPLINIYQTCDPQDQSVVRQMFDTLVGLFGEPTRHFDQLRAEFFGLEEAREIAAGRIPPHLHLGWVRFPLLQQDRVSLARFTDEERRLLIQKLNGTQREKHLPMLKECAVSEIARSKAWLQFRGSGSSGIEVLAWDECALYADKPAWVSLSLEECLRNTDFALLRPDAIREGVKQNEWPEPPSTWGDPLFLRLRGAQEPRRSIHFVYEFKSASSPREASSCHHMQGFLGVSEEFRLSATLQKSGGIARLPSEITKAFEKVPLVFFIPWKIQDVRDVPSASGLTETSFRFVKNGVSSERHGYIQQHAVLAHALLRRKQRCARQAKAAMNGGE